MSLLLAEGFEHFHPSIRNLSSYGPHVQAWSYRHRKDKDTHTTGQGPSNDQIDPCTTHGGGRKGGRYINVRSNGAGGSYQYYATSGIGAVVRKSRTIFAGIAVRVPQFTFDLAFTLGRSNERRSAQHGTNLASMTPVIGCRWYERGGYADLTWWFKDGETQYSQIFHNRNLANGDWHYIEFASTVYTGSVEAPTGWAKAKIGSVVSSVENINTVVPGSEDESFINAVSMRVGLRSNELYDQRDHHFDDFYICNDEGDVNNNFLGSVFVRPMSPSHTGQLYESYSVGAIYRHEAVGPALIGDDAELPETPPTPEEDPYYTPWDRPNRSHLVIPREGGKQNFRCTDVPFMNSNPRIFGVVATVIAEMPNPQLGRAVFTPIKTINETGHRYFPVSTDMTAHYPMSHLLIMENPKANDDAIDESDPEWSVDAVNNSDYGFRIDPVREQRTMEEQWNPALGRYPVYNYQTIDEVFGIEDWPSRHWEEPISETFDLAPYSRWDWGVAAIDGFQIYDESSRRRDSFCVAWSNMRMDAAILMPEKFMKDAFLIEDYTRSDFVTMIEESFGVIDTSYQEWVEQLQSWFDPYDFVKQSWSVSALDNIDLAVTDIFDNHFIVDEGLVATAQTRSNHEFLGETLYPDDTAKDGALLYIEDGFSIDADHHDGNWVENFQETIGFEADTLTRHWRFEWFMGICLQYWNVGVMEQPLAPGEPNPVDVKNDEYQPDNYYMDFIEEYYAQVEYDLQEQWLLAGGDPSLDFHYVRTAAFDSFVFEGGNAADMVDVNGETIIEEIP